MSVVVGAAILTGGGGGAFGGDGGFGCFLPTRDRERRGWRDCVWQAIGVAGMNLQWPEAQGVQHPSQRSTSQGSGDLTEPAAPGRYRRGAERGRDILGGHQFPLVHCHRQPLHHVYDTKTSIFAWFWSSLIPPIPHQHHQNGQPQEAAPPRQGQRHQRPSGTLPLPPPNCT